MNPHKNNKIDVNSLSQDEQRLFRLYGKLPNKKDLLQNKLKERKYFDSGDYALSKAGKASDTGVTSIGTEHPQANNIPHMSPLTNTMSRGDSISSASPPSHTPSLSTTTSMNNPMASVGSGDGSQPTVVGGPSPAGMHRGSINGIPGGGLPGANTSRSPAKESYLARTASAEDEEGEDNIEVQIAAARANLEGSVSPPAKKEGIPIRR